jgi:hypothetical protein
MWLCAKKRKEKFISVILSNFILIFILWCVSEASSKIKGETTAASQQPLFSSRQGDVSINISDDDDDTTTFLTFHSSFL